MTTTDVVNLVYLLAAVLFIFGLKMLSHVKTARQGNLVSAVGMLIAAVVTLFLVNQNAMPGQSHLISFLWIAVALAMGSVIGLFLALKVQMTAMPQMVALLNGFGGLASLLVACAEYANTVIVDPLERALRRGSVVMDYTDPRLRAEMAEYMTAMADEFPADFVMTFGVSWYVLLAIGFATLIGGVTFSGSLVAFGKLQGLKITPSAPIQFGGQKALIAALLLGALILSFYLIPQPTFVFGLIIVVVFALILGVLLVIGIGGADMPVVVALLNSYSGLAAAMAGFALGNFALIITGSLVGSSGFILTSIMCKAMNRSLMNVLFGGVGSESGGGTATQVDGEAREFTPEDAALVLEAAQQVMIVPGYGMAVAQAQHAVKELADGLESRGVRVLYAIHPVAGRMPGHMNVLLAEAGVPYESLLDLEGANNEFEQTDVALVIGANDVTNPAARHDKSSPLYGMPILDVDKARNVFVIKRSLNPGFAGIQNELYFKDNCGMIFGDGKKVVTDLIGQLEEL